MPIRIGFVLHAMQVAGAEVLVAETVRRLARDLVPTIFCLDGLGQLGEQMRDEGIPVVVLGRRPGIDGRVPRLLAREIASRGIEVVHAHQYTPFFYSALARLLVRRPVHVMFTEHGRHYPDRVSSQRWLANKLVFSRLADSVNAVCRFSADSLSANEGFSRSAIEIIENGIVLQRYCPDAGCDAARAALGLPLDRKYVVCIARFHPVKDHSTLVRAFARLAQTESRAELLLAGDGPLRDALGAQARSLGIASRVHFFGVRHDVPRLLQAADVFTLASLSEAASLTLLEAMASALPVVVTNVGGNPEIVEDGCQGLLVPRGDPAALARALAMVLDNPVLAREMGAAGRRRIVERYSLATTVSRYHHRYRDAVVRIRSPRPH